MSARFPLKSNRHQLVCSTQEKLHFHHCLCIELNRPPLQLPSSWQTGANGPNCHLQLLSLGTKSQLSKNTNKIQIIRVVSLFSCWGYFCWKGNFSDASAAYWARRDHHAPLSSTSPQTPAVTVASSSDNFELARTSRTYKMGLTQMLSFLEWPWMDALQGKNKK